MSRVPERFRPVNRARRHFLGLAAAASARMAAMSAFAVATLASSAHAKNGKGNAHGNNGKNGNNGRGQGGGNPHCFLRGTSIMTPTGENCIENLQVGDLIKTVRGEAMRIKWIGRNIFRKCGSSWAESVMPIRISRHAIDERTPHADLYLSRHHGLLLDGVLMPVSELVNGVSILPAVPAGLETIEYFHIILDTHEVILAEGAPAETCLLRSDSDYQDYTNFIEYERLYGNQPRPAMMPFAPLVGYGGGREDLKMLLKCGLSPFIQLPDPLRSVFERLAARADERPKETGRAAPSLQWAQAEREDLKKRPAFRVPA